MKLQTFRAATMELCLQQVKAALGHDALFLHTRTYQVRSCFGLRTRDVVEITAAEGQAARPRRPAVAGPPDMSGAMSAMPVGKGPGLSGAGLSVYPTAPKRLPADPAPAVLKLAPPFNAAAVQPPGQALLNSPVAGTAMILGMVNELTDFKQQFTRFVTEHRHAAAPKVPEELFDYYLNLIQNEVAEELAQEIVRRIQKDLRPDQLAQPHCVRERLAEQIERLVPACGPVVRKRGGGPHVLALIGPTGVGKTTTLAKLAANLKLKDHHRVGLITLDTYRIAAVDQLRRYADIICSPLRVVSSPDELRDAVAGMADMDYVLIDTAGRSPNDALKLNELRGILAAVAPDEVHLVLSSTSCQSAVELAVEKFGEVRVDRIIFTKLDEAAHVGVVLNVCHKVNKALSYVTTGQDVAKDIEVGRGRLLAEMMFQSCAPSGTGYQPVSSV